jgi:hypothetical protein
MTVNTLLTLSIGFLAGVLAKAVGSYFASKFTDRRRAQEAGAKEMRQFQEVVRQMPELISEMKRDLDDPERRFIREFFLTKKGYRVNAASPCLVYYDDDHPGIQGKIHVLENLGYVIDITPGNTPKYRMTEEFVRLVQTAP